MSLLSRSAAVAAVVALAALGAGCASYPRYRYQPRLTAAGADVQAALSIAGGNEVSDGNKVDVLVNGDQVFPAMLEAIRGARNNIHLETYIFRDGEIGRRFVDALVERARAGVKVRLLLDGIGSLGFGEGNEAKLREAGAQVVFFRPLKLSNLFKLHLRTHRKYLIVDGRIGFTGGICIDDSWMGNADRPDRWRETQVRVEGPVARQMQSGFARAWLEATGELLSAQALYPTIDRVGDQRCQIMESAPGFKGNPARLSFLVAVASAKRSIDVTNAYFVPDGVALEALEKAAQRGVQVRLLLPSRNTDVKSVRYAGRSYYRRLLEAGVGIYEYEPSRLHAKTMVVDGEWATVGSTNLDRRSFVWNYESNLNCFDRRVAEELTRIYEADLAKSSKVELAAWKKRPFGERVLETFYGLFRSQF